MSEVRLTNAALQLVRAEYMHSGEVLYNLSIDNVLSIKNLMRKERKKAVWQILGDALILVVRQGKM